MVLIGGYEDSLKRLGVQSWQSTDGAAPSYHFDMLQVSAPAAPHPERRAAGCGRARRRCTWVKDGCGLLQDSERNEAYRQGIEATVEEDDLVIDIGTGSGLLALMAGKLPMRMGQHKLSRLQRARALLDGLCANGLPLRHTSMSMHSAWACLPYRPCRRAQAHYPPLPTALTVLASQ